MLTQSLRTLERDGFVLRTVYDEPVRRVTYELTDLGRSLLEPMRLMCEWAAGPLGRAPGCPRIVGSANARLAAVDEQTPSVLLQTPSWLLTQSARRTQGGSSARLSPPAAPGCTTSGCSRPWSSSARPVRRLSDGTPASTAVMWLPPSTSWPPTATSTAPRPGRRPPQHHHPDRVRPPPAQTPRGPGGAGPGRDLRPHPLPPSGPA